MGGGTSARGWTWPSPQARCCACWARSEEHTSELQSQSNLVCRLLLEKKKNITELQVHPNNLSRLQPEKRRPKHHAIANQASYQPHNPYPLESTLLTSTVTHRMQPPLR